MKWKDWFTALRIEVNPELRGPNAVFTALGTGGMFLLVPLRVEDDGEGLTTHEGAEPLLVMASILLPVHGGFKVTFETQRVPEGFRHGTFTLTFDSVKHTCKNLPDCLFEKGTVREAERARRKLPIPGRQANPSTA